MSDLLNQEMEKEKQPEIFKILCPQSKLKEKNLTFRKYKQ